MILSHFCSHYRPKVNVDTNDTFVYFELLILLYADDTVLFCDNIEGLQHTLKCIRRIL